MKVTPKQYAHALYDSVQGKKPDESKQIIKEFVSLIAQSNDISKADKIINEFIRVYNQEQGIVEAEIKSARTLEISIIKFLQNYIKK